MKKHIYLIAIFLLFTSLAFGQNNLPETPKDVNLSDITISVNRQPIKLKNNPGSISLVTTEAISNMPKTIGVEESLRLVPGVRIDNQHDGERVHVSIRGQGILTERGLRGIGVLIDGIPVNDPSGFAPDLYDVDWATVKNIEVLRGPVAGLYGGGGAAGVININTNDGSKNPFGGQILQMFGSNGFAKSLIQFDGTKDSTDYRISFSRTGGDGYRDHQAFWSNKLYEKINFHPSNNFSLTQIISHSDYFQQNPEGLSHQQLDNPLQANPDACPFNEYQKSNRTTVGFHGLLKIDNHQDFEATAYLRSWNYKETSNRAAEYRTITNPGTSAQYNLHFNLGILKNNFSVGTDLKWQNINMYKLKSASNPQRVESIDQTNVELDTLLANQTIFQESYGVFALYKLELGKFNLFVNYRYDQMNNKLTDRMLALDSASTSKNFSKSTWRIGASYNFSNLLTFFANFSQGFMPPSTEELANNPVGYSGFNTHLVPATSNSYEIGVRGFVGNVLYFELTGFDMTTENDFFRFKQSGRGNQEVFYGNAGNSQRYGIETFVSLKMLKKLTLQVAYTYADYKYISAAIDPIYTDTAYVLTIPPLAGQWLPNSPQHQLYAELVFTITKNFKLTLGSQYQSKWAIYTDAKAYSGELDPAIYQNWQSGFVLYNASLSYQWNIWKFNGEFCISGRNLTGAKYMAFTEPDPDGNSYQPGPTRELFGSVKIKF